jgi:hypothetical protein
MTHPSATSLRGAATVFVVQDVLRSVEHYRDVLGFHTEFTYGQPTFTRGARRRGHSFPGGEQDDTAPWPGSRQHLRHQVLRNGVEAATNNAVMPTAR